MSVQQSYEPHHHLHHYYHNPHHSTPIFPSDPDDDIRENDIRIDDAINSSVNIIGLIAALLVSVVIIVGVAFVIRTIRKRQSTSDESEEESSSPEKESSVVAIDTVVPVHEVEIVAPPMDVIENTDPATTQVFTISFTEVPKRPGRLIRLVPKPLRPKRKPVDIEKLKRELGQIYVY